MKSSLRLKNKPLEESDQSNLKLLFLGILFFGIGLFLPRALFEILGYLVRQGSLLIFLSLAVVILFFALPLVIGFAMNRAKRETTRRFLSFLLGGYLLGIASIVIWLVSTTCCSSPPLSTEDRQRSYIDQCNAYCNRGDYFEYCTANPEYSADWDGDGESGRLIRDEDFAWAFCEDKIHCFFVTNCSMMEIDDCKQYLCQVYAEKYGDYSTATLKIQSFISASNNLSECYREVGGVQTYFTDLPPEKNWIYSGFVSKGWCNNTSLNLSKG